MHSIMLRLGWFSTGSGKGSLGLMNIIQECIITGHLDAKIEFVFCNREFGEGIGSDEFLNQVLDYDIPLVSLSSKKFRVENGGGQFSKHRLAFDREVISLLEKYRPDICVMAGYMLIAGSEFNRHYRIINLHPSPIYGATGTWQEVIWKLIENQAVESGAYIHIVTDELDHGPVISYFSFPIVGQNFEPMWEMINRDTTKQSENLQYDYSQLFSFIREQGLIREKPLLLETIRALADGKITISDDNLVHSNGATGAVCMNEEIEKLMNTKDI